MNTIIFFSKKKKTLSHSFFTGPPREQEPIGILDLKNASARPKKLVLVSNRSNLFPGRTICSTTGRNHCVLGSLVDHVARSPPSLPASTHLFRGTCCSTCRLCCLWLPLSLLLTAGCVSLWRARLKKRCVLQRNYARVPCLSSTLCASASR